MDRELTINATAFKATCLDLLDRLGDRRLDKVEVTKRGKVVAVLTPPAEATAPATLHGSMKGSVRIPPGVDLTAPILDEEPLAARGILHG